MLQKRIITKKPHQLKQNFFHQLYESEVTARIQAKNDSKKADALRIVQLFNQISQKLSYLFEQVEEIHCQLSRRYIKSLAIPFDSKLFTFQPKDNYTDSPLVIPETTIGNEGTTNNEDVNTPREGKN